MFSRAEHEAYQKIVEADLRPLRDMKAILDNKASQTGMNISLVISIIAIIVAVIHLFK